MESRMSPTRAFCYHHGSCTCHVRLLAVPAVDDHVVVPLNEGKGDGEGERCKSITTQVWVMCLISVGLPHVRCAPHGVHRTRGAQPPTGNDATTISLQ